MDAIQQQVVKTALTKLFTQRHFSICDVDNCLKTARIIPDETDYQTMRTLHCIDYSAMPIEVRDWLVKTVSDWFDFGSGFDLSWLNEKPKRVIILNAEIIDKKEDSTKKLSWLSRNLRIGS